MRHVHGPHVYDDQSDQWYRFDSEDEAVNFAAQGEDMRYVPTVREATATIARSGYAFFISTTEPQLQLVSGKDLSRTRLSATILYNQPNTTDAFSLLMGTQRELMSHTGLVLLEVNGEDNLIGYSIPVVRHTDDIYLSLGPSIMSPSSAIRSSYPIIITWVAEYTVS